MVPPTILMLTELAPPPKKRVTISVAKFGAVAEGMSQICPNRISQRDGGVAPIIYGVQHSQGTECKRQSSQAYAPCSPSMAQRAMERLPRQRSTRLSPSTAMGSYPARCRILLPSEHYQNRRRQQASRSRWSYGVISNPERFRFRWRLASNVLT